MRGGNRPALLDAPPLFGLLQHHGGIVDDEMFRRSIWASAW
jgi:hypothetical protein